MCLELHEGVEDGTLQIRVQPHEEPHPGAAFVVEEQGVLLWNEVYVQAVRNAALAYVAIGSCNGTEGNMHCLRSNSHHLHALPLPHPCSECCSNSSGPAATAHTNF